MILIENLNSYSFQFSFNQTQDFIINSLEKEFVLKYGKELFNRCSLIILVENENFYHVIRNKHKVRVSGELISNLCQDIQSHIL